MVRVVTWCSCNLAQLCVRVWYIRVSAGIITRAREGAAAHIHSPTKSPALGELICSQDASSLALPPPPLTTRPFTQLNPAAATPLSPTLTTVHRLQGSESVQQWFDCWSVCGVFCLILCCIFSPYEAFKVPALQSKKGTPLVSHTVGSESIHTLLFMLFGWSLTLKMIKILTIHYFFIPILLAVLI